MDFFFFWGGDPSGKIYTARRRDCHMTLFFLFLLRLLGSPPSHNQFFLRREKRNLKEMTRGGNREQYIHAVIKEELSRDSSRSLQSKNDSKGP